MRTFARNVALSLAALCVAPAVHAATPTGLTLTCYNGGSAALTINVNSLFFDTAPSQNHYFTVYTDISQFDSLVREQDSNGSFETCSFSTGTQYSPSNAVIEEVAGSVGMGGTYTQVTFSYVQLTLPFVKFPAAAALTAEEKAKSLAAYLARVPTPAASQK
jgi:hypothetical protein